MVDTLELRSVSVSGVETEIFEVGSGRPLLFLHSGDAPDAFSTVYLEELARRFRVVAPFHPGFGRLERPRHFRDVGDLSYFYLDLIRSFGLTDCIIVGAGLGGWIASEMAVRSTTEMSALILVSPFGIKIGSRETRDFADFFALSRDQRLALEFVNPAEGRRDFTVMNDDRLVTVARGSESEAFYGWNPFMHNPQLRYWLHRIDVPTLVVRGEQDHIVSAENHTAFARLIPNGTLRIIEQAGHHPHIEQPEAFVEAVRGFAGLP